MINKLPDHYSLENPASIFDEEAMTALELAGRTAKKTNECVEKVNNMDDYMTQKLDVEMPEMVDETVEDTVKNHIDNGRFDDQIEHYVGGLEERLNNAISGVTTDTEVVDARYINGTTYSTLSLALRHLNDRHNSLDHSYLYMTGNGKVKIESTSNGGLKVSFDGVLVYLTDRLSDPVTLNWFAHSRNYDDIDQVYDDPYINIEIDPNDDSKASITISQFRRVLVLDTNDYCFKERNWDNVQEYDLVLLQNGYSNAVGGLVFDMLNKNEWGTGDKLSKHLVNENRYIYLTQNGKCEITPLENGGLTVTIKGPGIGYRSPDGTSYTWTWSQFYPNFNYTANKATFTVSQFSRVLVLRVYDGEPQVLNVNFDNIGENDFILLYNGYSNASGFLVEESLKTYAESHESRIQALENNVEIFQDPEDTLTAYSSLFANAEEVDAFLFMTDPHLAQAGEDWKPLMKSELGKIKGVYERSPARFVICGGDWLGNSDTPAEARYKLGYIGGQTRAITKDWYNVVGNHDTNYQGTGKLGDLEVQNLLGRPAGASDLFYQFKTDLTNYMMINTGEEWTSVSSAFANQLWDFVHALQANEKDHVVLVLHMIYNASDRSTMNPVAYQVMELAKAFNERTSILFDNETVDFSTCAGTIRYVIAGHLHTDYIGSVNDIPVILTKNLRANGGGVFDLCLANYDTGMIHFIRHGSGENRSVAMVEGIEPSANTVTINFTCEGTSNGVSFDIVADGVTKCTHGKDVHNNANQSIVVTYNNTLTLNAEYFSGGLTINGTSVSETTIDLTPYGNTIAITHTYMD